MVLIIQELKLREINGFYCPSRLHNNFKSIYDTLYYNYEEFSDLNVWRPRSLTYTSHLTKIGLERAVGFQHPSQLLSNS